MRGKGGGACIVKRGMCGEGGMYGEGGMHGKGGVHDEGACVVTGWVCGKVGMCMVKACVIGGMHGKRGVTCVAGVACMARGVMHTGETATEADGTHSLFLRIFSGHVTGNKHTFL